MIYLYNRNCYLTLARNHFPLLGSAKGVLIKLSHFVLSLGKKEKPNSLWCKFYATHYYVANISQFTFQLNIQKEPIFPEPLAFNCISSHQITSSQFSVEHLRVSQNAIVCKDL